MHVIIIGAGWAGLAAGVELSRADIQVSLFEATKYPGGRARRVETQGMSFDNGQHLMLGAYKEMLRLQRIIGLSEENIFQRRRLRLDMHSNTCEKVCIEFPKIPAPWHAVAGFAQAEGLSWVERYRALALCAQLYFSNFKLDTDISVAEWLKRAKQSERIVETLWGPLCLAAMNTPMTQASAVLFIRVLHEAFTKNHDDADMLFPRVDLGSIFPEPALQYIYAHGGTAHFTNRVTTLEINDGHIEGMTTSQGETFHADHILIAASPLEALRLIEPYPLLNDISKQIAMLRYEPICTIYLQYPSDTRLGSEMMGLLGGMAQWIFDLSSSGHPGRMAAVISGPGPHMEEDNTTLIDAISRQISEHFPNWPCHENSFVIREKRASFSSYVGVNANRPGLSTPVQGCWLAGDYTATGLPATLEGAIRSGIRAAQAILDRDFV
jgi:hydroxysqualene dehydroxylase